MYFTLVAKETGCSGDEPPQKLPSVKYAGVTVTQPPELYSSPPYHYGHPRRRDQPTNCKKTRLDQQRDKLDLPWSS